MATRIDLNVSDILRTGPTGGTDNAISQSIWGINHRKMPSAVPINKDDYGLVFFTRPSLNLSLENIRHDRYFNKLATFEADSIQRIISCTLDPRLHLAGVSTTLVDHDSCFIPILTNHVTTMSGWPDSVVESYNSTPGVYGESYAHVDSHAYNYGLWQASVSFRNMPGDLITSIFDHWRRYAANVYIGKMVPYWDLLIDNEIDYMTRIWRLVLDQTRTYVQKIGCTGVAYPTTVPYGRSFDYQSEAPLNTPASQIDVQFQCIGAEYDDPILIKEFNVIVQTFNYSMRDAQRPGKMTKVPYAMLGKVNCRGYPRIHPGTYELEWYVPNAEYAAIVKYYKTMSTKLSSKFGL
jgi:uncharacterized protein affecting Mg2+/Co2+ transport